MAADDTVTVQYLADISDLQAKFDSLGDSANEAMDKVTQESEKAGESIEKNIGDGAEKAKKQLEELAEEPVNLGRSFEELHTTIMQAFEASGILLAVEAIHKVSEALEEAAAHATQIENMSDVLGINTDQYQALEAAADRAGVGMNMVSRTLIRLEEDFRKGGASSDAAADKLMNLGFTMEQVTDKGFTNIQMIATLAEHLQNAATHGKTMEGVTAAFGARAKQVAEALKEFDGSAEGMKRALAAINAVGEEDLGVLHKIHEAMSDMGHVFSNAISKSLAWTASMLEGTQAAELFNAAIGRTGLEELKEIDIAGELSARRAKYDHEDKVNAVAAAKDRVEAARAGTAERVDAEKDYVTAVSALYESKGDTYKKALKEEAAAEREFNIKSTDELAISIEDSLRKEEAATKKKVEVNNKASEEFIKAWNEAYREERAAAEAAAKATEEGLLGQADSAEKIVANQTKNKQIDPTTALVAEKAIIQARLDAQIAYHEKIKALDEGDRAALDNDQAAEVKATQKAADQMYQANRKSAEATAAEWKKINNQIVTGFDSALDGMLRGTTKFHQAVVREFDNLAIFIINQVVNSILQKWLAAEAAKIASSEAGAAVLKALGLGSMIAAKTQSTTEAVGQITDNAAVAASGAFAATALIPYIGPELAPAAALSAESGVLAYLSQLVGGAAEEGAVIPDHEMLMLLHPKEMVLPEQISKGIQEHFPSGSSSSSSSARSDAGYMHVHINALDHRSVAQLFDTHKGTLLRAMQSAARAGHHLGR